MFAKNFLKKMLLSTHGSLARRAALAHYYLTHDFDKEFELCVRDFVEAPLQRDSDYLARLKTEVRENMRKHLIAPDEYFLYGFPGLSDEEKRQYVGDIERVFLCARLYSANESGMLFMDKLATYERFSDYFKRDAMGVRDLSDKESFHAFVARHPRFIVKPTGSSRGNGIRLVAIESIPGKTDEEFDRILSEAPCIVEECISQAPEMARFHPESVNTIRYATFLDKGELTVLASFVKLGRGDSVVDNGGAGGFLAAVDETTGIISTPGRSEHGEVFSVHPDTGVAILGAQIPAWNELRSLAAELAEALPDQKYVGWDFAYSDKGWVLVEGNSGGQFVGPQISMQRGMRDLVDATFGSMGDS